MSFLDTQDKAEQLGFKVNKDLFVVYNTLEQPLISNTALKREVSSILNRFQSNKTLHPVGVQGLSDLSEKDSIGSLRQTVHDKCLSQFMTQVLWNCPSLNISPVVLDEYSPVDWQSQNPDKLNYWIPLHVSPVFRYMEYEEGGEHYTHYDAPYVDKENPLIRTLQSGVLYLTDNDVYTRFIEDFQDTLTLSERDLSDWKFPAQNNLVNFAVKSEAGKVLVFPHQLAHDVSKHPGGEKRIIIRFDIFYQAVGKV